MRFRMIDRSTSEEWAYDIYDHLHSTVYGTFYDKDCAIRICELMNEHQDRFV